MFDSTAFVNELANQIASHLIQKAADFRTHLGHVPLCLAHEAEEGVVVVVLEKDCLASIAAIEDVVREAAKRHS
jgi:hypothetical protein